MTGDHCLVAQNLAAGQHVPFNQQGLADKSRNGFTRIKNGFDAVCHARCKGSAAVVSCCTAATGKYVLQDQRRSPRIGEAEIENHCIAHRYVTQVKAGICPLHGDWRRRGAFTQAGIRTVIPGFVIAGYGRDSY